MNILIILSILINVGVCLATFTEFPILGWVLIGSLGVILIGSVLITAGKTRSGAYLVIAGSALFFPVGVIGVLGARKELDRLALEAFESRRTKS